MVNGRRKKIFIQRIANNQGWVTDHNGKESLIKTHFSAVMGKGPPRPRDFNWVGMAFPPLDLNDLGESFSELEVFTAIKSMPCDKAPGPDGFTGAFYKTCWQTIKHDIMRVVHLFSNLHAENFHWLNSANVVLIPKKEGAEANLDFRPISLIHGVAKIMAKMMSTRLAPHMNTLISTSQSASIKTRSIHNIFLGVRNYVRRLHLSKTPTILLKLDIKKAFDSVRWDYLLDLMQRCGFPTRFRNWVAALLTTSTSRVLLNGILGDTIAHKRGLWQGDPYPRCSLTSPSTRSNNYLT
jgi:hypothetical protein